MKNPLRRYAVGALAVGAIAGGAALGLPDSTGEGAWQPQSYGLTASPAQLLPANVSTAAPVRVVSTALDGKGRPVVTVRTATSKQDAAALVKQGQEADNAVGVELDAVVAATGIPTGTDPYRSQQWDFSKIKVANAWQKSTGADVTVAVIDTGVDAAHPDLNGNVLSGYDAIANTAGTSSDPNGHGTHVAGTIAAVTGNGVGVSGIAPDTKILPVRVLDANGSGYMSDTAEGIIWAADHGADVINMSLGSTSKVTAVSNAIAYARSKGVVVVAAAGNSRTSGSPTSYPAADEGVIGVAATDSADAVAYYSNAGSYVDVAAPGSSILSTYPTALGMSYGSMSGTSMASPHVAAVAALIRAYQPALTPDAVQAALQTSAVDLGPAGRDNDFGYGRIDAAAALAAVSPSPSPSQTTSATPAPAPTTSSPAPAPTTSSPAPAPSSASPTPSPTRPVAKVRPAIRVATSAVTALYGTTSTVTYTVTAGGKALAQQPVQVGVQATGASVFTLTEATTDSDGRVVVTQPATGTFQVKLVVPATDTTLALTSPITKFTVRAAMTVTSPAARSLRIVITGAAGQTVQVQRLERNKWLPATSFTASGDRTLTGLISGAGYRVVLPSTPAVTGVTGTLVLVV